MLLDPASVTGLRFNVAKNLESEIGYLDEKNYVSQDISLKLMGTRN